MFRYLLPFGLFAIVMLFILDGIGKNAEIESWQSFRRETLLREEIVDQIKKNHIKSGQLIADDKTTSSESQSYGMLVAVFADDQELFDEIWKWTEKNLQVREDKLFAWKWADGKIVDMNSATDADQDIMSTIRS